MIKDIVLLILLTLVPFLELRASIPIGILKMGAENWLLVFLVCVIANILLAPLVWFFIHYLLGFYLKIKWIDKYYNKIVERIMQMPVKYLKILGFYSEDKSWMRSWIGFALDEEFGL